MPAVSTLTKTGAGGGSSVLVAALGSAKGIDGWRKLEVSMKKISSRKTTSMSGAMSKRALTRLGLVKNAD
jgi:hypothetical protein